MIMDSDDEMYPSLLQRFGFARQPQSKHRDPATTQDLYPTPPDSGDRAAIRAQADDEEDASEDELSPTLRSAHPVGDVVAVRPIIHIPLSRKKPATASTNGVAKTKKTAKKVTFRWAKQHIRALHVLREQLQMEWDVAVKMFNLAFHDDIVSYGFKDSYGKQGLSAQYGERLKEGRRIWQEVLHPDAEEEAATKDLKKRFEDIAKSLNGTVVRVRVPAAPALTAKSATSVPRTRPKPSSSTIHIRAPLRTLLSSLSSTSRDVDLDQRGHLNLIEREVQPIQPIPLPTTQAILAGDQIVLQAPRNTPSSVEVLYDLIGEAEAHPVLPALFYRYYHDSSQGTNGPDGFVSGLFDGSRAGFPPTPALLDQMIFHHAYHHINRDEKASPFISVSMTLNWVIRQALQALSRGESNARISVIDASIAGHANKAFYAPPFHRELKKQRPFTNGAFRYSGTYEFLIWANIPNEAIICDFPLSHLTDYMTRMPVLEEILRFDILGLYNRSFRTVVIPQLEARDLDLKPSIIAGIAKLAVFFGIDATSNHSHIAKIITDLVEGWRITPKDDSTTGWKEKAKLFANCLCASTSSSNGPFDEQQIAEAFRAGVTAGLGEYHWFRDSKKARTVRTRASRIGLHTNLSDKRPRELLEVVVDKAADMRVAGNRSLVGSFRYRGP